MAEDGPNGGQLGRPMAPHAMAMHPMALLAEARRDELLRAAAEARLAAQVPRAPRGRRRVVAWVLRLGRRGMGRATKVGRLGERVRMPR